MSYIPLPQDTISSSVKTIAYEHSRTHDGKAFLLNGSYSLANGATAYVLADNPAANYAHLRSFVVTCTSAPMSVELYEGCTVSANGTSKNGNNMNRNSVTTPNLQTYTGPTVTADGTLLEYTLIPGAKQSGGSADIGAEVEWILKPSTKYALKITNSSGATVTYSLKMFWYEM
jgi:hypothetical protein